MQIFGTPGFRGHRFQLRLLTALVVALMALAPTRGRAQSADQVAKSLPPVIVQPSEKRRSPVRSQRTVRNTPAMRTAPQSQRHAQTPPSAQLSARSVFARGTDPIPGFVPSVSSAGTKTDTPIVATPQSISVISRDNMDARDASSVIEALQYTAGVNVQPGGKDPRYDNVYMRGFDNNGYGNYRDGLRETANPTYSSLYRSEQYGLERIDVVKGPSSVLYGQNAPGGLINLITKRPQDQPFGEIVGTLGNYDRFQGAFDLGGPVDKDKTLFYRLTGLLRDSDAQIAHFSDYVKDDRQFIAPAVTWKPNADTTLTVLSDYLHDVTGNAFPLSVATLKGTTVTNVSAFPLFLGDPNFNKFDQQQYRIGYQFEHRFSNDLVLRSSARYGHIDLDYRYLTYSGTPLITQTTYSRVARQVFESSDTLTFDNNLTATFATGPLQHTALLGTDYLMYNVSDRTFTGSAPSLNRLNPVYGVSVATPTTPYQSIDQSIKQVGVYMQDQVKFQNWILTLGGRFDAATQRTLNLLTPSSSSSSDDTAFTKRIGLSYVLNNNLVPYISYSESFLPTTGVDYSGNAFKPTTSQQYEGGVKFQPVRNVLLTGAVYDLTQQNVLTQDPSHSDYKVQIGEVNSRGFEAEVIAEFFPGLNVIASYTQQVVRVTQSNDGYVGKTPVLVPGTMASAYADYTFQSGALANFGFGAGIRYNGKTFADQSNTIVNPDYTTFDAGVHYKMDNGVTLALNVKNIGDTVRTACTVSGGCQYTSPRVVTLTAKYRW